MARSPYHPGLLGRADAGGCAAEAGVGPLAHLDKDQGAPGLAQDQVDLAAAPPRRPIIARDEAQPGGAQMRQGAVFSRIAYRFGGFSCPELHDRPLCIGPGRRP